jgi:hypothetical protein
MKVTGFDRPRLWPAIHESPPDPGLCVIEAEPVVMLGGNDEEPDARADHHPGPAVGIVISRQEEAPELVIGTLPGKIVSSQWPTAFPGVFASEVIIMAIWQQGVDTPVKPQSELPVQPPVKRLLGGVQVVCIDSAIARIPLLKLAFPHQLLAGGPLGRVSNRWNAETRKPPQE